MQPTCPSCRHACQVRLQGHRSRTEGAQETTSRFFRQHWAMNRGTFASLCSHSTSILLGRIWEGEGSRRPEIMNASNNDYWVLRGGLELQHDLNRELGGLRRLRGRRRRCPPLLLVRSCRRRRGASALHFPSMPEDHLPVLLFFCCTKQTLRNQLKSVAKVPNGTTSSHRLCEKHPAGSPSGAPGVRPLKSALRISSSTSLSTTNP